MMIENQLYQLDIKNISESLFVKQVPANWFYSIVIDLCIDEW